MINGIYIYTVHVYTVYPIPSMYGIFTYIYHILPLKTTIHVGNHTWMRNGYAFLSHSITGILSKRSWLGSLIYLQLQTFIPLCKEPERKLSIALRIQVCPKKRIIPYNPVVGMGLNMKKTSILLLGGVWMLRVKSWFFNDRILMSWFMISSPYNER